MLHTSRENGFAKFVTMQNHYNLIYREEEREMIPLCLEEGIGLLPWSPLARGFLAGNRSRQDFGETIRAKTDEYAQRLYYQDSDFTVVQRVGEVAKRRGVSNAQVALAWILSKPGVTAPIVGASKMSHLDDALAALDLKLDAEEVRQLEEPYTPHGVLGHSVAWSDEARSYARSSRRTWPPSCDWRHAPLAAKPGRRTCFSGTRRHFRSCSS